MKKHIALALMACASLGMYAVDLGTATVTGSIQSDMLVPQQDEAIGTEYTGDFNTNTYLTLNVHSQYISAGLRAEFLEFPLPGFEDAFKGWGVPHFFVSGNVANTEITAGTFYEQFGSGFVLYGYEERSLGVDNAILGGRIKTSIIPGVRLKALAGIQRHYWEWTDASIMGADVELGFEEWFKPLAENNIRMMLGASYVSRHEEDEIVYATPQYRLNLPANVGAFDARLKFGAGGFDLLAEYAYKANDPTASNGYIYKPGQVAMLSASYSQKGMSFFVQAKRSDNFAFRTERSADPVSSSCYINYLPAFSYQHTYALAALYPYATQLMGEWAFQGEFRYKFPRKTALGGKYGTDLVLRGSLIYDIERNYVDGTLSNAPVGKYGVMGSNGYTSPFFGMGDLFYAEAGIELSKKFTKDFKLSAMYMFQKYNKSVIEGEGGMIDSHIIVLDGKYQISKTVTARMELQYLNTKQDQGDWLYGLVEVSVLPYLMFTVADMWNVGDTNIHYYQALVTGTYGSHRLQAGYVRTRAGYNCAGGVCRYIPATRGVQISYSYNF